MSYSPTLLDLWRALRRVLLDVNAALLCAEGVDAGELPPGPLRSRLIELLDSNESVSENIGRLWVEGRECELRFLRLVSIELGIEFGTLVSLSDEQLEARLQTVKPECGGQVLEVLRGDYPAFATELVRHLPEQGTQVTDDGESEYIFRRDGDGWFIRAFGVEGHFRRLVGFEYLERLIKAAGQLVPMNELVAAAATRKRVSAADAAAAGLASDGTSFEPLVDEQAVEALKKEIEETVAVIRQAERVGDVTQAEIYRNQLAKLEGQYKAVTRPGGKLRGFRTEIDRLRPMIHDSIRTACDKLRSVGMKETAAHFEVSIRAEGDSFIYSPSPPILWQ